MMKANNISLRILTCILLAVNLLSCSSDIDEATDPVSAGEAMEFTFNFPQDDATTRAKEVFVSGDNVYITATVNTLSKEGVAGTVVRSTIMEYKSSGWEITSGSNRLYWPADAVDGKFIAYYLPQITDAKTRPAAPTAGNPTTIAFSDLRDAGDDPLTAEKTTTHLSGVINLQFAHMTTRLNVTGLKSATQKITFHCNSYAIDNQITFSYDEATGYTHAMSASNDQGITMDVAASATSTLFFISVDASAWQTNKAGFQLFQEVTEDAKANGEEDMTTSLGEINLYTMTKGRAYRVYFYSGTTNTTFNAEEKWYPDVEETKIFQSEEAIHDYFAAIGTGGLQEDLDFNNIHLGSGITTFAAGSGTRGITLSKSFNGNHHTIRNINVENGLFNDIPSGCTVSNLKLENVTVTANGETTEYAGLLAPVNNGIISNVRLEGNNSLGTYNVTHAGGLVGCNLGTIESVQISGILTMDCYAETVTSGSPFNVGGLVGSNGLTDSGAFTIKNSRIIAAALITAAGTLASADACIGGFAGYNAINKSITGSDAHVIISASKIDALNCYTGGFIGMNRGKITSCDASGDVTGGTVTQAGSDQKSATGGFAGYTTSGTEINSTRFAVLSGCSAIGDVTETPTPDKDIYTGGLIGFSEIDLLNCSSTGTVIPSAEINPKRKTGALAGLISADKTISNSFSMSEPSSGTFNFTGDDECKTANCHYLGFLLDNKGEAVSVTTAEYLNKTSVSGYWEWTSSASTYGGAPYLVKQ